MGGTLSRGGGGHTPAGMRADSRLLRPSTVIAVLAVAQAIVLLIVNRGNAFIYDDWFYFVRAREAGFAGEWIFSDYFQHLAPGHRAASTVIVDVLDVRFLPVLVLEVAAIAFAVVLFERCCRLLWGARWIHVLAAFFFGFSILMMRPLQWWSNGQQVIPTLVVDLICLYGFLRWRGGGSRWWIALSAGAMTFGLLFYIRPILMIGILLLLRILLFEERLRPGPILAGLWRERLVWLAYLLPALVYAAFYLGRHVYEGGGGDGAATPGEIAEFVRISWLRSLAPSFLGIRIPVGELTTWQTIGEVLAQVLILGFAAFTIVRRRSALRAWTFWSLVFLGSLLIVGVPRLPQFGPEIGFDLRYLVDYAWLLPLSACAALAPRATCDPADGVPRAQTLPVPRAGVVAGVAVVLAGYSALTLTTMADINREWEGDEANTWVSNVRDKVPALPRGAILADRETPNFIVPAFIPAYNTLRQALPLLDDRQVDGPVRTGPVYELDDSGTPRPVGLAASSRGNLVELQRSGAVVVVNGPTEVRGDALCVTPTTAPALIEWTFAAPAEGQRLYLELDYSAPEDFVAPLFVDDGNGYPGVPDRTVSFARDAPRSLTWLRRERAVRTRVDVQPGDSVCVNAIAVGILQ